MTSTKRMHDAVDGQSVSNELGRLSDLQTLLLADACDEGQQTIQILKEGHRSAAPSGGRRLKVQIRPTERGPS